MTEIAETPEVVVPHTIERAGQEKRYQFIVDEGKEFFQGSGIVDSSISITENDIGRVRRFHNIVSPKNWVDFGEIGPKEIEDPSTFGNWEDPGGPLEHINLAMESAPILLEEILKNLKSEDDVDDPRIKSAIDSLRKANPNLLAVAAGLHDEGRELTHIFLRTDLVGGSLLNKIGVIDEIKQILPEEKLMLTPLDQSMDEAVLDMSPEAVLIRIADDFGKRMGGTERLMQPSDIKPDVQEAWAQRYRARPQSGAASDAWMRKRFDLHNANAERYSSALSNWLIWTTGKPLEHYTQLLNAKLAPTLPSLPEAQLREKVLVDSQKLSEGEVLRREIIAGEKRIEIQAVTQIGGPNKKWNEDGGVVLSDGNSISVVVVDGGTQLGQIPSLGELTGGRYIRDKVEQYAKIQSPNTAPDRMLTILNSMIGHEMRTDHSDIEFSQDSTNIPYGSIAAVRVDVEKEVLELANAGDVFVIAIGRDDAITLFSKDNVYPFDQLALAKAHDLARKHGVSFREAIEHAFKKDDERFTGITEQMHVTMRGGASGEIERIMGLSEFAPHAQQVALDSIKTILIGSDGAVPAGIDIHTGEGVRKYVELISEVGVEGLIDKIKIAAAADPEFEESPRFRDIDDMILVQLSVSPIDNES